MAYGLLGKKRSDQGGPQNDQLGKGRKNQGLVRLGWLGYPMTSAATTKKNIFIRI